MDGVLMLEDGTFFRGTRFGAADGGGGEVVFNTSLTGYQEIVTDPSYAGQMVVLTYPHIGNYGVNAEDVESARIHAAGLIVRDHHPVPSNWRSTATLSEYLAASGTPGLCGVDTRALVGHIRRHGALRGVIRDLHDADALPLVGRLASATGADADLPAADDARLQRAHAEASALPSMAGQDLARAVTCAAPYTLGEPDAELHVVVVDFGAKKNILRQLLQQGCRLTVVPASTTAEAILAMQPDGVMLSNGPGDPEPVTYAVETIRALVGRIPIFGICLGHQLLGIALGGRTFKLPFGHRGANHPVRDLDTGRVEITSQNHGFAVDPGSLDGSKVALTHLHLNDDTVAGLRHRFTPTFSVQFHPEASPGPHDSHHLFERFGDAMRRWKRGQHGAAA
ncbi:MAG: hypothetical protein RIT45_1269 [Pseudomonadota bacterium]|jgi:carbamoyl-phosphate synthase small subunit